MGKNPPAQLEVGIAPQAVLQRPLRPQNSFGGIFYEQKEERCKGENDGLVQPHVKASYTTSSGYRNFLAMCKNSHAAEV